jgi:uncharacterized ion transporter superfamily protein YfcC
MKNSVRNFLVLLSVIVATTNATKIVEVGSFDKIKKHQAKSISVEDLRRIGHIKENARR